MDDRTLLELAARAAGISASWDAPDNEDLQATMEGMFLNGERSPDNDKYWNPLRVDGDAFRLAVRLAIDIEWSSDGRVAAYRHANANGHCFTAFESSREDRYVNTRRAIVRAAAAIGEGMG